MNVATRSGSNKVHGSAFEYLRNGEMNARNFFAARNDGLKRNQYGFSLGGPLVRTKRSFSVHGKAHRFISPGDEHGRHSDGRTTPGRLLESIHAVNRSPVPQPIPGNRIPTADLDPIALRFWTMFHSPTPPMDSRDINAQTNKNR